mmetsp:Transcript_48550/g.89426  ORF Transcript_48550/g.89426 Transcript_48550/m.89426 type:complete len:204 (+) Transcript_48550:877-1488(+)
MWGCHRCSGIDIVGVVRTSHCRVHLISRGTYVNAGSKAREVGALVVHIGSTYRDRIIDVCWTLSVCIHASITGSHHHCDTRRLRCSNGLPLRVHTAVGVALRRPGSSQRHRDDRRTIRVPRLLHPNGIVHPRHNCRTCATAIAIEDPDCYYYRSLGNPDRPPRSRTSAMGAMATACRIAGRNDAACASRGTRVGTLSHRVATT